MGQLRGFQIIYNPLGLIIAYFVWQNEGFWTAIISLITFFTLKVIIGWGIVFFISREGNNLNENHLLIFGHFKNIIILILFYWFFFGFQLPISKNNIQFINNTTKKEFLNIILKQQRERDFEYTKEITGLSDRDLNDVNECVSDKFSVHMDSNYEKYNVFVPNFKNQKEMNDYALNLLEEEEVIYSYHTLQCVEIIKKKSKKT